MKLDPLLLIPAMLDLVKRVFEQINNLDVCFCFFLLEAGQRITDELRETERLDQHHQDEDFQSSVPAAPICNPPNQTKTRVNQETVLAWARMLLIDSRPDLHIAISITVCSLGLQLFFNLLYLGVKLVPFLLCLQGVLIRLRSVCLYDL